MTIKECYESVGARYEEVLHRFGTEELVERFALKFLKDTTFQELEKKMQEADGEEAFRAAHTLKGVCLNLGFTALGEASSVLTEAMRNTRDTKGCEELMDKVSVEYKKLTDILQRLDK